MQCVTRVNNEAIAWALWPGFIFTLWQPACERSEPYVCNCRHPNCPSRPSRSAPAPLPQAPAPRVRVSGPGRAAGGLPAVQERQQREVSSQEGA